MTQEQLRMQMLAGIITESQYKQKLNENPDINLPNISDEDIKNELLKNLPSLLNQSEVSNGEIRIPWDLDSENADPKTEIEYNTFTKLYGVEYLKFMGTEQEDDATEKLEHISDIMMGILRDKFSKIILTPINN